jgi:hypothetical protein
VRRASRFEVEIRIFADRQGQPTKFDMAVNQTAKVFGIDVPTLILLRADEVIE